jgi:hypothetical protein
MLNVTMTSAPERARRHSSKGLPLGRLGVTIILIFPLLSQLGCTTGAAEGRNPGECSDGVDNDGNGYYDCDENACKGSPDCAADMAGVPKTTGGGQLFAEGVIQDLALTLPDASLASLRVTPEQEVSGTLEWNGSAYTVAVRLKGNNSFRTIDQKPSFKIDVHAYDPAQDLDGLERLTLNNMIQDRTMMREHAYYWLSARFGLPAPRHAYARVTVNAEPYGLYGLVETMDEQLVNRAFPSDADGNLYESSGDDFLSDVNHFELEESGGLVPTPDDVDALVDVVEATRLSGFDAMIGERFARDKLLLFLAVDTVIGNGDGYVFNAHNYFAYHGAVSDRWQLLPWGADRSFNTEVCHSGDVVNPLDGVLAESCWADGGCAADLAEAIDAVLGPWDDEFPALIGATEALIRADAEVDLRREDAFEPEDLRGFVERRGDFMRACLNERE